MLSLSYLKTERGRNNGTSVNPGLTVVCVRWLDNSLAVWCNRQMTSVTCNAGKYPPGHVVPIWMQKSNKQFVPEY